MAIDRPEDLDRALPDRYSVERELGRGGMAVVYLAHDRKHDRRVALKVLRPDVAGSMGAERFLREIRIAANLSHPHILALYDSGEAGDLFYYVMPYVEGETLRERMDREGPLPLEEALDIIREVAGALSHAHDQGLVHRDIKPENIFLSRGHALLADFGIARAVGEAGTERLTRTGLAIGTPRYMSPEQWFGEGSVDARTDVYSLACVLYEMLVGEPPFTGPTPQVVLASQAKDAAPSVREARPEVPDHVEAAVGRALAKEPDDRYAGVDEFRVALSGEAPAGGTGGPGRWTALLRRLRQRAAVRYAAILLVVSGLAYAGLSQVLGPGAGGGETRMLVLPFRNIGPPESDYFAAGITEELTGRLTAVGDLAVIAPTSARQYADSERSPQEIGEELDLDYLMQGSVRWGGGSGEEREFRVTSRLVRASDGTQVWADDYDGTGSDVLGVQSRIAREVIEALDVVLGEEERERLGGRATEDLAAFDHYLKGNEAYARSWQREDVTRSIELYRQATGLDPGFAEAFARLGQSHAWMFRLGYDRSDERLDLARTAIDSALALDPRLPEARVASALYHYWGHWDYERAIADLATARELEPGNALVHRQIANVRRRQGEWEAAVTSYRRAGELDPRNHLIWHNLAEVYLYIRQYEEAERYLSRVRSLAPDWFGGRLQQIFLRLNPDGDVEGARSVVREMEEQFPPAEWRPLEGFWTFGLSRILYGPREALERMRPGRFGLDTATYHLAKGEVLRRLDRPGEARAQYDSARIRLERRREPPERRTPDDAWVEGQLGVAYAALGRHEEGVAAARNAVDLSSRDAFDGPQWILNLARVHGLAGDTAEAVAQLELLVSIPSRQSVHWLREDPVWDPLRDRSGFRDLLRAERDSVAVGASGR